MTYVVTDECIDVKDKACLQGCPVDCLYVGARMTYIHPDECIDCGACVPLCPQNAIHYEPDMPPAKGLFAAVNAEFFCDVGSPGDSISIDLTNVDHPTVANWPF